MGLIVARISSCGRHHLALQGFAPIKARAGGMANADYPVRLILEAVKVNRVFNIISNGNLKIGFNRLDALHKYNDIESVN
ncbi:hypothetical protein [Burkholderia contaminans]|uniref:hypothetical protein n=1 Tax=Burkholderia contaminans TaxID=488447 RepID=UPI001CF370F8|nr:hypothetical protein [Burkholderia contaminans]MCA8099963.1 hypothetical protein [Burkholderia contaminans]